MKARTISTSGKLVSLSNAYQKRQLRSENNSICLGGRGIPGQPSGLCIQLLNMSMGCEFVPH